MRIFACQLLPSAPWRHGIRRFWRHLLLFPPAKHPTIYAVVVHVPWAVDPSRHPSTGQACCAHDSHTGQMSDTECHTCERLATTTIHPWVRSLLHRPSFRGATISTGHARGNANYGWDFDSYSSTFATSTATDTDNFLLVGGECKGIMEDL